MQQEHLYGLVPSCDETSAAQRNIMHKKSDYLSSYPETWYILYNTRKEPVDISVC